MSEPFVQVRVNATKFKCSPANTSDFFETWANVNVPTFKLHPASSCDPLADLGPALDEVSVRGVTAGVPTGVIYADENPCIVPTDGSACTTIRWETAEVIEPKIQVRVGQTTFGCSNSNVASSKETWDSVNIPTFKLYPASDCTPSATLGPPIAEVQVFGASDAPTCEVAAGRSRVMDLVEPEFLGIIANELYHGIHPEVVSAEMAQANVHAMRRSLRWNVVQPTSGASFSWGGHDLLYASFVQNGVKPRLTIHDTPAWASSSPFPKNSCHACASYNNCEGFCYYPPNDVEDWKTFIREAVRRYGTGQTIQGQVIDVDDWEIWLEPIWGFQGSGADYVELLNAAYTVIHEEDPNARVWAPEMIVYNYGTLGGPRDYRPFIKEVLANGQFDGVSIHLFQDDVEGMLLGYREIRALVDQYKGPFMPIAVTATQAYSENECPYIGATEDERARTLEDIYVCLANEGADSVYWYKTTERQRFDPNDADHRCVVGPSDPDYDPFWCACALERSGVLSPFPEYSPNLAYDALKAIGDFIHAYP